MIVYLMSRPRRRADVFGLRLLPPFLRGSAATIRDMPKLHCGASIDDVENRPHLPISRLTNMVRKRTRDSDSDNDLPPSKRGKLYTKDRLSSLSDELTLRVLSFLPVAQLVKCQRYVILLSMCLVLLYKIAERSDYHTSTTF